MRVFEHGNWGDSDECPLCNTKEDTPVTLVPISGTKDGNNIQAKQVHVKCIGDKFMYYPEYNAIIIQG